MTAGAASSAEAPQEEGLARRLRGQPRSRPVSFPELVWAHHLRQEELKDPNTLPYEGPCEERFRDFEHRFEMAHGEIVASYWCSNEASGVAMTIRRRPLILPDVVELHWATDWSTKEHPLLAALLYRCENLAVRVHEVLRDTSQRIAMQRLFIAVSYILGFAESERAKNEKAVAELEEMVNKELAGIKQYYEQAAVRSGQIVYVVGMLLGMVPMVLLGLLAWLLRIVDLGTPAGRIGVFCFAAGSVGALVSVMSRMTSRRVQIDWEFGKDTLRTLGALRPFVGAVFGLMTYFALKSGVIDLNVSGEESSYFFVLFAFAAGFSERLAQDMLLASTIEGLPRRRSPQEGDKPEPASQPSADGRASPEASRPSSAIS
jgi:hypothetical protein